MSSSLKLTFVVAANDSAILHKNLLASPCLQGAHGHQVIVQEGFTSATAAYNAALAQSVNEIVVFIHQDVYLPEGWLSDVGATLQLLAERDPNWGVLGSWGVKKNGDGFGYLYTPGQSVIGHALETPEPIQTLDEVVLILRRSSGLQFNEQLPGFHLYGTDICMAAAAQGLQSYAISAFCIHNSRQHFRLPNDFYVCYGYVKRMWKHSLPIETSCIRISRFDRDLWERRIRETFYRIFHRTPQRGSRTEDPRIILRQLHTRGQV
jgi:Glycosyltransferase like family